MKLLVATLITVFSLSAHAAPGLERVHSDGASLMLKRVVARISDRILKVLCVDRDGHEQRLVIAPDDAIELKRGLWVVRSGNFQVDI